MQIISLNLYDKIKRSIALWFSLMGMTVIPMTRVSTSTET